MRPLRRQENARRAGRGTPAPSYSIRRAGKKRVADCRAMRRKRLSAYRLRFGAVMIP
jgi:hypothetical protein